MRMKWLFLACIVAVACHRQAPGPATQGSADQAPAVGAHAPAAQLTTLANTRVALANVLAEHDKTVLVFYRGFY